MLLDKSNPEITFLKSKFRGNSAKNVKASFFFVQKNFFTSIFCYLLYRMAEYSILNI